MQHHVVFVYDPSLTIATTKALSEILLKCSLVDTILTLPVYIYFFNLSISFNFSSEFSFLHFILLGRFIGSAHAYCNLRARLFCRAILIAHASSRFDQVRLNINERKKGKREKERERKNFYFSFRCYSTEFLLHPNSKN